MAERDEDGRPMCPPPVGPFDFPPAGPEPADGRVETDGTEAEDDG